LPKLPVATGPEVVRALERDGYMLKRRESTHVTFWHPQRMRAVTVVDHGSKPLRRGTLRAVIRDAGLTVEEFCRLLK
jgi:predicted RNA binding protein YcfA (HicA-like mRNA interferase family)